MSDSVIEIGSLVNASDVNVSDVNVSDVNVSDVNTSDVNVSDVNMSDVNAIDVNTSLVNTSDVNASDVNAIDVNTNAVQIVTPTKPSNQDCMQKISIIPTVAFELYRVFISSFLILFVPQKCEDHVCQLHENLVFETAKYGAGVVFNFITMAGFLALYFIEIKRENRLICYLEVCANKPSDNVSVEKALELLPLEKRAGILYLDKCYQKWGFCMLFLFLVNAVLSGFVVFDYYLDKQTTSTYITNILFIITKLVDIYSIANTEKNVFYSAYLKDRIQYNDVDPDKMVLQIADKQEV
jgi:hypothetical protein